MDDRIPTRARRETSFYNCDFVLGIFPLNSLFKHVQSLSPPLFLSNDRALT
jgi:hypothetical protein